MTDSRNIQFRAWDKKKQRMVDINFSNCDDGVMAVNGDWNDIVSLNELVWLEYVGLKDKNRKKIYEGDIVKVEIDDNETDIGNVWYMAPMWKINSATKEGSYDLIDWGYGEVLDEVEVIGNIYENSNLLKKND